MRPRVHGTYEMISFHTISNLEGVQGGPGKSCDSETKMGRCSSGGEGNGIMYMCTGTD